MSAKSDCFCTTGDTKMLFSLSFPSPSFFLLLSPSFPFVFPHHHKSIGLVIPTYQLYNYQKGKLNPLTRS